LDRNDRDAAAAPAVILEPHFAVDLGEEGVVLAEADVKAGLEAARNKITYSLLGLAIVVGVYAISYIIMEVFGVSILGGVKWPGP